MRAANSDITWGCVWERQGAARTWGAARRTYRAGGAAPPRAMHFARRPVGGAPRQNPNTHLWVRLQGQPLLAHGCGWVRAPIARGGGGGEGGRSARAAPRSDQQRRRGVLRQGASEGAIACLILHIFEARLCRLSRRQSPPGSGASPALPVPIRQPPTPRDAAAAGRARGPGRGRAPGHGAARGAAGGGGSGRAGAPRRRAATRPPACPPSHRVSPSHTRALPRSPRRQPPPPRRWRRRPGCGLRSSCRPRSSSRRCPPMLFTTSNLGARQARARHAGRAARPAEQARAALPASGGVARRRRRTASNARTHPAVWSTLVASGVAAAGLVSMVWLGTWIVGAADSMRAPGGAAAAAAATAAARVPAKQSLGELIAARRVRHKAACAAQQRPRGRRPVWPARVPDPHGVVRTRTLPPYPPCPPPQVELEAEAAELQRLPRAPEVRVRLAEVKSELAAYRPPGRWWRPW